MAMCVMEYRKIIRYDCVWNWLVWEIAGANTGSPWNGFQWESRQRRLRGHNWPSWLIERRANYCGHKRRDSNGSF